MTHVSNQPTSRSSRIPSLSLMMFFQYAVWGVWLPYLAIYVTGPIIKGGLGFTNAQLGWILGLAGSIGAISAPFLAGQIADRFINAEKYLGILLVLGGLAKFATAYVHDYQTFLLMSILYSILYMPTLALTNSIAFAHLAKPESQFAPVRTWGTIGWIVASTAFPLIWLQTQVHSTTIFPFFAGVEKPDAIHLIGDCLRVSGVMAVLYGFWAMVFLPATPPTRSVEDPLAFARAFGLLKKPGFLIVTIAALPISMIHQVYFIRTSVFLTSYLGFQQQYAGPIMAIGQFSEIIFLALLGLVLRRLGYRTILAIGCLAFGLRYGLFAITTPDIRWVTVAAMGVHGICYAFFFAGAYVYVDRVAPTHIRHSAQTVFGIIILGVGPVLGGLYNQILEGLSKHQGALAAFNPTPAFDALPLDWSTLWYVQAGIGAACAVFIALAFRSGLPAQDSAGAT